MIQCVQNDDECTVIVNNQKVSVSNVDMVAIWAECGFADLGDETGVDFPSDLNLDVWLGKDLAPYPFEFVALFEENDILVMEFACDEASQVSGNEDGGLGRFLVVLQSRIKDDDHFVAVDMGDDDNINLHVRTAVAPENLLRDSIASAVAELNETIREVQAVVSGTTWKSEYEDDQGLFCTGALAPLLKRMGFRTVRYTDGVRENGKDFTFSELGPFGDVRHYGLLARVADLSGDDDATIKEISREVTAAFSTPYSEGAEPNPRYISGFVIAISGRFTENAQERIIQNIPKELIGSVIFLDRERILDCIEHYSLERE